MKKTLITLLMMLVILGIGTTMVSAVANVRISASNTNPTVDGNVTVNVSFTEPVTTASFNLSYNSSVLEFIGSNATGGNGTLTYNYIDLTSLKTISGASFTFKAKAVGSSTCSVTGINLSDAKANEVGIENGGSVTVQVKAKSSGNTGSKPNGGTNQTTKPSNNTSSSNSNKKPTFSSTSQKVYATETVTIRESWSTTSKSLGTLQKDSSITRTGIGSNGWDRVNYNGRTAYISHTYLTTTKPADKDDKKDDKKDDDKKNEEKNNTTNEVNNEVTNNTEQNNTINDVVNNEAPTNSDATNKKPSKGINFVEIAIIGVIVIAILVIIISEVTAKRKGAKRSKK